MYTRKEFADIVGIAKSELYYYEKRGLLLPDSISPKGFRYYSEESVLLYLQIRKLQKIGYSLDEIQSHLNKTDGLSDDEFYAKKEKRLKEQLALLDEIKHESIIQIDYSKKMYKRPIAKKEKD